jgi:hypothetical protein
MADVAQLVRASDCGSEGRGFKTRHSPHITTRLSKIFKYIQKPIRSLYAALRLKNNAYNVLQSLSINRIVT